MCRLVGILLTIPFLVPLLGPVPLNAQENDCVGCHEENSPGIVADWRASRHSQMGVDCATCHRGAHTTAGTPDETGMPTAETCAMCHQNRVDEFMAGKHALAWAAMNAMPTIHWQPMGLTEGMKGCGGCHKLGAKSPEEIQALNEQDQGYGFASCDACHTRHLFSKEEARQPQACQTCHMGFDHPQWEMWSSSKHGSRYLTKEAGDLPKGAVAPGCQTCHMPDGDHENRTAWGFLGVRLPLPEDPQWKADRVTILKALGVLNPKTGQPTARLDAVKALDMARFTEEAWQKERKKMIKVCHGCHSEHYAMEQLSMGDTMMKKADRLMADAIETVAGLYRDGIIEKPDAYTFPYPDFFYFMRTGGGKMKQLSHIDQILLKMYLEHRMRTFQAFFHVNPDYAYWYGWAAMVEGLGEIKELARSMRAIHKQKKE